MELPPPQSNAILESTVVTEVKPKPPADDQKAKEEAEARKALRAQILQMGGGNEADILAADKLVTEQQNKKKDG